MANCSSYGDIFWKIDKEEEDELCIYTSDHAEDEAGNDVKIDINDDDEDDDDDDDKGDDDEEGDVLKFI